MANFQISQVSIQGISAAVPADIESNFDYPWDSEREGKLFVKTTGVESRRKARKGLTTSDLCFKAVEKLISDLSWKKSEIDILIFVSQSNDYYLPATSIILQDRLGLSKSCLAFDIGLGCSGYVYGLSVLSSMLSSSGLKKGILLAGDISSLTCSFKDKSTYPLFGDAGTATAMEFIKESSNLHFDLNSDGSGYESIIIPDGGARNLISESSFDEFELEGGIKRTALNLALNGVDVFNFSIHTVVDSLKNFLESDQQDTYDYFILHQANLLMNETVRKKLKVPSEKVPYSLSRFGNTSSASIPLTIVDQLQNEVKSKQLKLLLCGFGVGLSWGIVSLEINQICCPDLIEV
jgi:3-oxoacyl-[acyl-carrier-protein] synthase-3